MKRSKKHPGSKYSNVCSVVCTSSTQNMKHQVIKHENITNNLSSEMRQNFVGLPEILNVPCDEPKQSTTVINQVFQKKRFMKTSDSSSLSPTKNSGVNISNTEKDSAQSPIKNKNIFLSTRDKIDQVNSNETDERKKTHIELLKDEISTYKKALQNGKQNQGFVTSVRDLNQKTKLEHVETLKISSVQPYTTWNKEDGNILP